MAENPRSMRDRVHTGEPYLADDPELARDHQRAMALAVGNPARVVRALDG